MPFPSIEFPKDLHNYNSFCLSEIKFQLRNQNTEIPPRFFSVSHTVSFMGFLKRTVNHFLSIPRAAHVSSFN